MAIQYARNKTGNPSVVGVLLQESASNNGSAGTAAGTVYTTGSVAGDAGSAFAAINSSTASGSQTVYRVDFSDDNLPGDIFILEYLPPSSSLFTNVSGSQLDFEESGTNSTTGFYRYGMRWELTPGLPANSVNVVFGNGGARVNGAAGVAGEAWSSYSTWKWKIRRLRFTHIVQGAGIANLVTPGLVWQSGEIDILSQMTSAQAGASFSAATAIVSKDKNGKWRMKGEITMGFTSVNIGAGVAVAMTIAGISARGTTAVSSWWGQSSLVAKAFVTSGGGTITAATYNYGVTSNSNGLGIHFDFPIDAKPSWA